MTIDQRCTFRRTRLADRRSRTVSVKVNDHELAAIRGAARARRMPVAAYLAYAAAADAAGAVSGRREVEDLRVLRAELGRCWTVINRVGSNLNQLAKVANSTGDVDHARLGPTLAFVRRSLTRIEATCQQIGDLLP